MQSSKTLTSSALGLLCVGVTLTYMPSGGIAEHITCTLIAVFALYCAQTLYRPKTLAQTTKERREQISSLPVFNVWLLGGWVCVLGALLSVVPLPLGTLSDLSPPSWRGWSELSRVISASEQLRLTSQAMSGSVGQSARELITPQLSLSPVHTWRWVMIHLAAILTAYMSALTYGVRRPLIWCLSALGPMLALIGLAHWSFGLHIPYGVFELYDRVGLDEVLITPLVNPNHAASLMILSLFITLGLARLERSPRAQVMIYTFIACTLVGLVASGSRAALGITLSLAGLWSLHRRFSARTLRISVIALLLTWLIFIPCVVAWWSHQAYMSSGPSDGSLIKGLVWHDCVRLVRDHLIWGAGRGSFGEVFTQYQSFFSSQWISHAENLILTELCEGGLWGLIGGLSIPLVAWSTWLKSSSLKTHPLALGLSLGLAGVVMHQGFDFGLESLNVLIPSASAWGLMWSYYTYTQGEADEVGRENAHAKRRPSRSLTEKRHRVRRSLFIMICAIITLGVTGSSIAQRGLLLRSNIETLDLPNIVHRELIRSLSKHPVSAHHALRLIQHHQKDKPRITSEPHALLITHAKRLAPQWSTPLMLEARLLNSSGLGELAAISYRRALELDRVRRDFILSELIKAPPTPTAQVAAWLPRAHRLAYYKLLITREPERARRFLEGFKAHQLSGDHDIRAIWIRQLGRASRESLAGRVKSVLMKRIRELLDQGERSLAERAILSADLRALICYQRANQYTEEYSLEVELSGALRTEISRSALFSKRLNSVIKRDLCLLKSNTNDNYPK